MSRIFLTAMFGMLVTTSLAPTALAQDKKDSPLVAAARKKIEKTLTVEFKDQPLKDVMNELGGEVELRFYLGTGVPQHKSITYKAKDKSLKMILDEMLKPHGLGYIIHRKEKDGDRYEGWVQIVQGDQRGDAASSSASSGGKKPTRADESNASKLLTKAKNLAKQKKNEDAVKALEELLEKYGETKAATEAKKLMEKLKE